MSKSLFSSPDPKVVFSSPDPKVDPKVFDEVSIDWSEIASGTVETIVIVGGAVLAFVGSVFVGVLTP